MVNKFRYLAHTADIGLYVRAETLPRLFISAAQGMLCLLFEPDKFCPLNISGKHIPKKVHLSAPSIEDLLVSWLNEILYQFNIKKIIPVKFKCKIVLSNKEPSVGNLQAQMESVKYLPEREGKIVREIKAATYHRLKIKVNKNKPGKKFYLTKIYFDV